MTAIIAIPMYAERSWRTIREVEWDGWNGRTNQFRSFREIIVPHCGCDELARFLGLENVSLGVCCPEDTYHGGRRFNCCEEERQQ